MRTKTSMLVVASAGLLVGVLVGIPLGTYLASSAIENWRPKLELLYFLTAGPLMLAVLIVGLSQIYISAREIAKKSRRDAASLAVALCEKYAREYLPIEAATVKTLRAASIGAPIEWKLLNDSIEWSSFAEEEKARKWGEVVSKHEECFLALTSTVNMLEALAMAFVHGEADMEIGFRTIGEPFCQAVRRWAPHLAVLRTHQTTAASGAFACTANLYRLWQRKRRSESA